MSFIGRIMLKILSFVYLIMAIIGLLGYFQIGDFFINIFSFFFQVLGFYSIILPIICIIFAIICWKISINKDDKDNELHKTINKKKKAKLENSKTKPYFRNEKLNTQNLNALKNINNNFSSYFANELSIKNENLVDFQKDYSHFGVDFPTYFGSGKKNIYLPQKVICLQGFKEYFSNDKGLKVSNSKVLDYTKAENINNKNIEKRYYHPKTMDNTLKNNCQTSMNEKNGKQTNNTFDDFNSGLPQTIKHNYGLSEINFNSLKNEYCSEYRSTYYNNDFVILDEKELDKLFKQSAQLVISNGIASTSFLQKRLRIGYSLAARLMDMLEEKGIIGEYKNSEPRTVLVSMEEFNNKFRM